ncbi:MAG: YdeI/OmpD-associated family protein [Vicinamibacterales bacterium]
MSTPEDLEAALEGNPRALANYEAFPPFSRKAYVHWIANAKREETRRRRLAEAVEMIERNVKLPHDNG